MENKQSFILDDTATVTLTNKETGEVMFQGEILPEQYSAEAVNELQEKMESIYTDEELKKIVDKWNEIGTAPLHAELFKKHESK